MFIIKSIDWLLLNIVNTITTINIITVTFTCMTMDCLTQIVYHEG